METDSSVKLPMELVAVGAKGELDRWLEKYRGLNAFVLWGILSSAMLEAQKRLDLETQLAASEYAMAQAKARDQKPLEESGEKGA